MAIQHCRNDLTCENFSTVYIARLCVCVAVCVPSFFFLAIFLFPISNSKQTWARAHTIARVFTLNTQYLLHTIHQNLFAIAVRILLYFFSLRSLSFFEEKCFVVHSKQLLRAVYKTTKWPQTTMTKSGEVWLEFI